MKAIFIFLSIFLVFLQNIAQASIFNPFSSIATLNIGYDYIYPKFNGYSRHNSDIASDAFKFKSSNVYAGLRLFRYFGIETGYSRILSRFTDPYLSTDLNFKQSYVEGKIFLPIISTPIFSIDGYASYGFSKINAQAIYLDLYSVKNLNLASGVENHNAKKYGIGLEASIIGTFAARVGYYRLDRKIEIMDNKKLDAVYAGVSMYF
ncbi:hypothetical protein [Candidatus Deianiraea vastatrix]|uniref:Outer membrane protein beta-barrel domain-containing protein n=1 Tax=Candidatus Deianiraea vastatrix TaxID=2163644 RepID=A0A5B8XDQ9_9RICK|nr:hypothetical protein [Candidatus Deianiraea vastatrix]QED23370.1 hypothetical protein Deia_00575 [Candidatus Deianiraea vastatrix]